MRAFIRGCLVPDADGCVQATLAADPDGRHLEARLSVCYRLRNESVDLNLSGIHRFTTVAEAVENGHT